MIDQDDFIENDKKNDELSRTVLPFDLCPLALRLELQEEADFQHRFEKQQHALLKVRKIAQARLEYNQNWLEGVNKGALTSEDYINTFVISERFFKLSKIQQEQILLNVKAINWKEGIENDRNFFLDILESNKPYFLDMLYLKMYVFDSHEKVLGVSYISSNKNNELQYSSKMLKILEPFLTKEFHYFFLKIKNCSVFDGSKKLKGCSIFNVIKDISSEFLVLQDDIINSGKKHSSVVEDEKLKWFAQWKKSADEAMEAVFCRDLQMQKAVKEKVKRENIVVVNLMRLDVIEQVRSNFSVVYNLIREAQEIKNFIIHLKCKNKVLIRPPVVMHVNQESIEVVETTPALDELPIEDNSKNEVVDDFMELKKQQLFLWQERVQQRKAQKEEQLHMQRVCIDNERAKEVCEGLKIQNAQQLVALSKNIDEEDRLLYHTLFKSDPSCKPHNVRFRDIEKLIKSFGGTLEKDTASSHFIIHLPDTHHVWEQVDLNSTLSYMDIPQATGGSYKPHHSDEWSRSAHYFLQKAFVKAGITPERLARAVQIILMKPTL